MSSPGDERGPSPHVLLAVLSAAVVAAAAGAALLLEGDLQDPVAIATPAIAALVVTPLLASRLVAGPLRREAKAASDRATKARRSLHRERQERTALRELDRALAQSPTERDALEVIRASFTRHLEEQALELHLVDPVEPVLALVVSTGNHQVQPTTRMSPWDSLAARTNTTLIYDSTDRLDVCSHLKSRVARPAAAVAVPLNATGRLLGVLYCLAEEGSQAGKEEIAHLEDIAAIVSSRVAVLRSVGSASRADAVDRLTGLPDRGAMQERVLRLLQERQSFSVAVADIDQFSALNASQGRAAGDTALQTLSRVARRTIRPEDIVGRIGGDELLFILPRTQPDDATRALERLREELVLSQSTDDRPPFTLSIGVIGSSSGGSIEEILHRAAGALNHAKSQGGNRVVVAQTTKRQTED